MIDAEHFIDRMEGFIKKGSKVQEADPLKAKEIWESKHNTIGKTFSRQIKSK